jgi:putative tryptophan/tyrosine transport system substrate-binding protein
MERRDFITLVGSLAAWPLTAGAQQSAVPVIGFLSGQSPDTSARLVATFRQGLNETGYIEGQNVAIEYRWALGQADRLPGLAASLVERHVAVIAATAGGGTAASLAAKAATSTIPIVFTSGVDPVKIGLVASMNRPGGNVTGIAFLSLALEPKRLGFLRELVPQAADIVILLNPTFPDSGSQLREVQDAASTIGLRVAILYASDANEIDAVFASLDQTRPGALLVGTDPFYISRREQIIALAARHGIPVMYDGRDFTEVGGLISYGASFPDAVRQVGVYTGRILKGERPADLPVLQPTKIEMVLNLKTAKALGLAVPQSLLVAADEVIE